MQHTAAHVPDGAASRGPRRRSAQRRGAETRHRRRRLDRPPLAHAARPHRSRSPSATAGSRSSSARPAGCRRSRPTDPAGLGARRPRVHFASAPRPARRGMPRTSIRGRGASVRPHGGRRHARIRTGFRRDAALRHARGARVDPAGHEQPPAPGPLPARRARGGRRPRSAGAAALRAPVGGRRRRTCRKPARQVPHGAARARRPAGSAAQRARNAGRRHRRPQGGRGARHPHGAGVCARTPYARPSAATTRSSSIAAPWPGHREVEEFRILYLNRKNRLIADECLQKGSVCHTPVYPREVCIRCLELQASAIVALHPHPAGDPEPSRADIDMTNRIRDALKTIEVTLLDHVIVTPTASFSFQDARSALTAGSVGRTSPGKKLPGRSDRPRPFHQEESDHARIPATTTALDPVISVYTRAQAIEDGILVDVSETAREAGFRIPVAITRTVWSRLVALARGLPRLPGRARTPVGRALDGAPLRAPRLRTATA